MNDLAYQAEVAIAGSGGVVAYDPLSVNQRLNRTPMSALDFVYPIEAMKRVLADLLPNG